YLLHLQPPTSPTTFPYTTLFRSSPSMDVVPVQPTAGYGTDTPDSVHDPDLPPQERGSHTPDHRDLILHSARSPTLQTHSQPSHRDRKSTRLNSSHDQTSYAVFCL